MNAGIRDSFGIVQLSGKPGEKRRYRKINRRELEARRWESVGFPSSRPGVLTGEGEATWINAVPPWVDMMSL